MNDQRCIHPSPVSGRRPVRLATIALLKFTKRWKSRTASHQEPPPPQGARPTLTDHLGASALTTSRTLSSCAKPDGGTRPRPAHPRPQRKPLPRAPPSRPPAPPPRCTAGGSVSRAARRPGKRVPRRPPPAEACPSPTAVARRWPAAVSKMAAAQAAPQQASAAGAEPSLPHPGAPRAARLPLLPAAAMRGRARMREAAAAPGAAARLRRHLSRHGGAAASPPEPEPERCRAR